MSVSAHVRGCFLDGDRVARELGRERLASRRARELGRHEGAFELETGGQRLFHEPHALHNRQPAPSARLAALEIADGRLQITANACPRTGHRCP